MFHWIFIALLFMSFPVSAQNVAPTQASPQVERTLIRSITLEGFQLENKDQFVTLFKLYRNKHLSKADMDMILQKVREIYEQEGFGQLVFVTYSVNKRRLIFTASLTS